MAEVFIEIRAGGGLTDLSAVRAVVLEDALVGVLLSHSGQFLVPNLEETKGSGDNLRT